jgi:hypothetical protein
LLLQDLAEEEVRSIEDDSSEEEVRSLKIQGDQVDEVSKGLDIHRIR